MFVLLSGVIIFGWGFYLAAVCHRVVTAGIWASQTLTWHTGCNISIWCILHMHLRWVHVCVLLYQWSQLITVQRFSHSSQLNLTQSACLFLLTRLVCHFPGVQQWVNSAVRLVFNCYSWFTADPAPLCPAIHTRWVLNTGRWRTAGVARQARSRSH